MTYITGGKDLLTLNKNMQGCHARSPIPPQDITVLLVCQVTYPPFVRQCCCSFKTQTKK